MRRSVNQFGPYISIDADSDPPYNDMEKVGWHGFGLEAKSPAHGREMIRTAIRDVRKFCLDRGVVARNVFVQFPQFLGATTHDN